MPVADLDLAVLCDGVVRLRPFTPSDAGALTRIWRDPEIRKRNTVPEPDADAALVWIAQRAALAAQGRAWEWAIVDVASGQLAGRRSIKEINWEERRAICAAWVDAPFRGRRFSPRSLRLAAAHAFANGIARIQSDCEADNAASIASMLAAGLQHEGTLRDYFVTNAGVRASAETFSLLPADLKDLKPL